jgi:hypothetical protein
MARAQLALNILSKIKKIANFDLENFDRKDLASTIAQEKSLSKFKIILRN